MFRGSSSSGQSRIPWIDSNTVRIVRAGDHWLSRMSRQMPPVLGEMFGCHTFDRNFMRGAR